MKRAVIVLKIAAVFVVAAFATSATGLGRLALWPVVQTCVANYRLTGAPFPCLEVDLSDGTGRDYVVLRPPLLHDLIVVPTREIAGIEDPYLQSPGAPNYFNAAWQARSFLRGADGRAPERAEIALVANSAALTSQDQLHIHVGCLAPPARRALAAAAPKVPIGNRVPIGAIVPQTMFWECVRGELTFRTPSRFGSPPEWPYPKRTQRALMRQACRSRLPAFASKATTSS